jgi:hypothetical protein
MKTFLSILFFVFIFTMISFGSRNQSIPVFSNIGQSIERDLQGLGILPTSDILDIELTPTITPDPDPDPDPDPEPEPIIKKVVEERVVEVKVPINHCFDNEVGSEANNRCNAKPGCASGFFQQTDPRDGKEYTKVGCDTISEWEKFYANTPSIEELLDLNCRANQKTKSECIALPHCDYLDEYNFCVDKE